MATQSPFPFLDDIFSKVAGSLKPPPWMVEEVQRRVVLLVNHVLMQEPEAQARLARQSNRVLEARWRNFVMRLVTTPAGLLDVAHADTPPDLTLTLAEESPWGLAQAALRGDKPPVRIAGDVQFAAEINWLVDNVRWDLEEDLSRLLGDAPAHAVGQAGRSVVQALRQFVARAPQPPVPPAPPSHGSGQAGA
jgi:ubiquinone biosynthesis protein UbiJ